jgi:heme oxygenase
MSVTWANALHAYLRTATADEHARLEADVARMEFFTSLPRYMDYLRRFGAFQSEIEQILDAHDASTAIPDWPSRRRAHLARVDLTALGASAVHLARNAPSTSVSYHEPAQAGELRVVGESAADLQRGVQGISGAMSAEASCRAQSQERERAFLEGRPVERILGMAYVVEGSTLGGAYLLKRLAGLGVTATQGGAFLASYGNARGRMWQHFLGTLENWDRRGVAHGAVVAAALDTFHIARMHLIGGAPGHT